MWLRPAEASPEAAVRLFLFHYAGGGIAHAHFSAFHPIRDTPLEEAPPTPALREHRAAGVRDEGRLFNWLVGQVPADRGAS